MAAETEGPKALTKNPLGPTGEAVAANVERLRNDQHLTFAALAERLSEIGRPIPTLGLRKIVNQSRRVDADDLVALAVALDVSPISLLMPASSSQEEPVRATGVSGEPEAGELWDWLRGWETLGRQSLVGYFLRAWPAWFQETYLVEKVEQFQKRQGEHIRRRRAEKGL